MTIDNVPYGSGASSLLMNEVIDAVNAQAAGVFATSTARDSAIASPTEGMVAYLTTPDQWTGYTNGAWVILHEAPQTWNVTAVTQNGSRACTTTAGWYQRSNGVFRAHITITGFAAGSAGNQIQVAAPFTLHAVEACGGTFSYDDSGTGFYTGAVLPLSTTVLRFQVHAQGLLGVTPSFATASADTLRIDIHGRY